MSQTTHKTTPSHQPYTLVFDRVGVTRETKCTIAAIIAAAISAFALGIAVARADEDLPHTRHDAEYARYARMAGGRPAVGDRWADYLAYEVRKQDGRCDTISGAWGSADGWSLACNHSHYQYAITPKAGRLLVTLR